MLEQRVIPSEALELRAETEEERRLSGYGIVYNRKSQLLGGLFREVILPGAASEILQSNPDIQCAYNHDTKYLFGRTKSGTLTLEEDISGVRYTANPPDSQWAKDALISIQRGDIDGSSFTFAVDPDGEKWLEQEDGTYLREIHKFAAIGEMGPVSNPAYLDTTTNVRSIEEVYESNIARLRAQDEQCEIEQARARRVRDAELLKIQLGGKK